MRNLAMTTACMACGGWRIRQWEFRLVKPRPLGARADPARQAEHHKIRAVNAYAGVDPWALNEVQLCVLRPHVNTCWRGNG
jgi:hypothetical protein